MNTPDLKLVLVGDKHVGKTSVFNRYVYDEVFRTQMTIGAYFALKKCKIKDREHNIAIWDTAGQEKFDALTKFYTRGAKCAIICYDLTERYSFLAVKKWAGLVDKDCATTLLGNKKDLIDSGEKARQITCEAVAEYAKQIGALHIEGSALTGDAIETAFQNVVTEYIEKNGVPETPSNLIDLDEEDRIKPKKKCC